MGLIDHAQASIHDGRLLVKLENNPGVNLRQALIQIRLLLKEIQYFKSGFCLRKYSTLNAAIV